MRKAEPFDVTRALSEMDDCASGSCYCDEPMEGTGETGIIECPPCQAKRWLKVMRAALSHRDALAKALAALEHEVGMACVERNTPIIGKVTAAQWSRVETALEGARAALATAAGGGAS